MLQWSPETDCDSQAAELFFNSKHQTLYFRVDYTNLQVKVWPAAYTLDLIEKNRQVHTTNQHSNTFWKFLKHPPLFKFTPQKNAHHQDIYIIYVTFIYFNHH